MNEAEFAELAAGHALHALSPDDERAFAEALAAHPEWAGLADSDAAAAAHLADAVTDETPPSAVRDALLARIAAPADPAVLGDADAAASGDVSEAAPTTEAIQTIARRNWTRGLLALAASLVFLVTLGFGTALVREQLDRSPAVIALDEIESAPDARSETVELIDGGVATAHWSESLGRAVVVSDRLPPLADDQTFELWLIRDGTPLSAGVFDAASDERTTAVLDGAMEAGDVIAITIEPAGGAPGGAPTSDPIAVIPTA